MAKKKSQKKGHFAWGIGEYHPPNSGSGADYTEFHVQEIDYVSVNKGRMIHDGRIQVYSDAEGEAEAIASAIVDMLNEKFDD